MTLDAEKLARLAQADRKLLHPIEHMDEERQKDLIVELISKVFADDEKMIVDGRRRPALSGFTLSGKAREAGQVGYGERFSATQRVLKLALY